MNIPKILMQTHRFPKNKNIEKIILNFCPDWKYEYFTDDNIKEYCTNNPSEEFPKIIDVFNNFKAGGHKSQIFRYYYLYINGGVFLDSDAMIEMNLDNVVKNFDFVSVKSHILRKKLIFDGFMCASPKHPITYEILKFAYNTNPKTLERNFHYLCHAMYNMMPIKDKSIKLYNEFRIADGIICTLDDEKNKILTHYQRKKIIPIEKYIKSRRIYA